MVTMDLASAWCTQFKQFCARLDASCGELRRALEEPPAFQRGENLPTFVDSLNEAVSSMSAQVESLEAMTVSNVSLDAMLGHCMELYKQHECGISALEAQLQLYGYSPGKHKTSDVGLLSEALLEDVHISEHCEARPDHSEMAKPASAVKETSHARLSVSDVQRIADFSDDDDDEDRKIFAESFSLRDLGLSSAALAAIADHETKAESDEVEATGILAGPDPHSEVEATSETGPSRQFEWEQIGSFAEQHGKGGGDTCTPLSTDGMPPAVVTSVEAKVAGALVEVSEEEFKRAPAFLKSRFPLQDLNDIIIQLNNLLIAKGSKHADCLDQADIDVLKLGMKSKECILLLVRLGRLSIERKGDCTAYRPVYE